MNLAETFVLNAEGAHLWVVITRPDANGSVVIVNFTSHRAGCDETCIVEKGEHPFVTHKTVVAYEKARLCEPKAQDLFKKNASTREPVKTDLLQKIQKGALESDLMVQKFQALVSASIAEQKKG